MDSQQPITKADHYRNLINKRFDEYTLEAMGEVLSCDKSTVGRLRDQVPRLCRALEILGLKVVSADKVCVKEKEYLLISRIAAKAMANEETARALFFDDVE